MEIRHAVNSHRTGELEFQTDGEWQEARGWVDGGRERWREGEKEEGRKERREEGRKGGRKKKMEEGKGLSDILVIHFIIHTKSPDLLCPGQVTESCM